MKNKPNIDILKRNFNLLFHEYDFVIKDVESFNYAIYANFISPKIGIRFSQEFRDFIPQLQFTILEGDELKVRPGLYSLQALYKNEDFI
ncbi:MAG: hypothetical protein EOP51_14725, partial [Sphingobacteriales bacterium]